MSSPDRSYTIKSVIDIVMQVFAWTIIHRRWCRFVILRDAVAYDRFLAISGGSGGESLFSATWLLAWLFRHGGAAFDHTGSQPAETQSYLPIHNRKSRGRHYVDTLPPHPLRSALAYTHACDILILVSPRTSDLISGRYNSYNVDPVPCGLVEFSSIRGEEEKEKKESLHSFILLSYCL